VADRVKGVGVILTLIYTAAGCIIAFQLSMLWQIRNDLNQILQTQRFIYAELAKLSSVFATAWERSARMRGL
jgi:hypothetical protein